mmetsp:Transcript_28549/g.39836  ORF Transcript_28549/g.39836 Transcript_28549/m.39836 type:complete len:150 (-) Transcript_28549:568-1017(-)
MMPKRSKVEGKMVFVSDYEKILAKRLKLEILEAATQPESFKDRKMAQPGVFVFNSSGSIIYSFIKEGVGPYGRPIPQDLFPIIAKHASAAGGGGDGGTRTDSKGHSPAKADGDAIGPIPQDALKGITMMTKEVRSEMEAELFARDVLPV